MANPMNRAGAEWSLQRAWLLMLLIASACDFTVTNPGPVQDEFLDDPAAFEAIVNGAGRTLGEAMNYIALHGAIVTRELFPTGQTGQFGIEPSNAVGRLDQDEQGTPWSLAHQARWLAENGLERFQAAMEDADFSASAQAGSLYLWAGYANRLLGENMCQAVFDGGAPQESGIHLTRAEDQFTQAIGIATAAGDAITAMAAAAGRASVRADLGDWDGAVADASAIPGDFIFALPYYEVGDEYQYNRIAWASMNQPYKAHTVWGTVYEEYYPETGDPRTPWLETSDVGTGALDCCGSVPWYPQQKYDELGAIKLSSGREMRLIEAEALLREGRRLEAMQKIDALRVAVGVDPWPAPATDEEAWRLLKRERGIELWLEARRLGDLRRWQEAGTPGALDPLEVPGDASHLEQQDLCFPVSRGEQDTNPNIG